MEQPNILLAREYIGRLKSRPTEPNEEKGRARDGERRREIEQEQGLQLQNKSRGTKATAAATTNIKREHIK